MKLIFFFKRFINIEIEMKVIFYFKRCIDRILGFFFIILFLFKVV